MRRFQRGLEPDFLATNWENWGLAWEQLQARSGKFSWRQWDGEAVNHRLLPTLKSQTQEHCSFCDAFPVSPPSLDTIEHFRPKSAFPREAYYWPNLYFCCMHCQQKGAEFDDDLLRPDAPDFDFDRYFSWDFTRGTLNPNAAATAEDQRRAEVSIRLFHLNEGHPRLRRLELEKRAGASGVPLDYFAYRHYV